MRPDSLHPKPLQYDSPGMFNINSIEFNKESQQVKVSEAKRNPELLKEHVPFSFPQTQ
jgi:hypothetical protein